MSERNDDTLPLENKFEDSNREPDKLNGLQDQEKRVLDEMFDDEPDKGKNPFDEESFVSKEPIRKETQEKPLSRNFYNYNFSDYVKGYGDRELGFSDNKGLIDDKDIKLEVSNDIQKDESKGMNQEISQEGEYQIESEKQPKSPPKEAQKSSIQAPLAVPNHIENKQYHNESQNNRLSEEPFDYQKYRIGVKAARVIDLKAFEKKYSQNKYLVQKKEFIPMKKDLAFSDDYFSRNEQLLSSLVAYYQKDVPLVSHLNLDPEGLLYECTAVQEEILMAVDPATLKGLVDAYDLQEEKPHRVISACKPIASVLPEGIKGDFLDIVSYREVQQDGNSFFRAFMFSYIENAVVRGDSSAVRKLFYEISQKLAKRRFIHNGMNPVESDVRNILSILNILMELLDRNSLREAYSFMLKSYLSSQEFDSAMVKLGRIALGTFIIENKEILFNPEFDYFDFLPVAFLTDTGYHFDTMVKYFLMSMDMMEEKLFVLLMPFVMNINLEVLHVEGLVKGSGVRVARKEFLLKQELISNSDERVLNTVSLVHSHGRFYAGYSKGFLGLFRQYMCDFEDRPQRSLEIGKFTCVKCNSSDADCFRYERVCVKCVYEYLLSVASFRGASLMNEGYFNIECTRYLFRLL